MAVTNRFEPNPRRTLGYRAFRTFVHVLWGGYFRPQVTGTEHVPETGPYIIAPIHRSNADFAFAIFVTKRKTFFMAKDELWKSKLLGEFVGSMGAFPVTRGVADRAALSAAEAVLRSGEPLVLFPEGTRQDGPSVGTLHEGAAFLAARTGAPIVPVGIAGTDRAMPRGKKLPRPVKVRIVVGDLVAAPVARDGARVPRTQLTATTTALRDSLQAAYDQACGRLSAPAATS